MTDGDENKAVKTEGLDRPRGLLTISETAETFHVSDRTVRRWIKMGELRVISLGRLRRIEPGEVERRIRDGRSS